MSVRSTRVCQACGLTLIDRAIRFIKGAGAATEASTERDGFLSYASETHAAGSGIGLGFMIAASGEWRYLGGLLQLVLYGNRGETSLGETLFRDIRKEKPYFLGGLVLGALLGAGVNGVTGVIGRVV